MFKFITILFGTIYVVCVGVWMAASFRLFGFDEKELALGVLDPLGWPWIEWFEEQLSVFTAPLVTMTILLLMTYLAKRNIKGSAR